MNTNSMYYSCFAFHLSSDKNTNFNCATLTWSGWIISEDEYVLKGTTGCIHYFKKKRETLHFNDSHNLNLYYATSIQRFMTQEGDSKCSSVLEKS